MHCVPVFRFPPGSLMDLPDAILRGEVQAEVVTSGPNLLIRLKSN